MYFQLAAAESHHVECHSKPRLNQFWFCHMRVTIYCDYVLRSMRLIMQNKFEMKKKALTEHAPQLSDRLDLELPIHIIAIVTAMAFNLLLLGQLFGLSLALPFLLQLLLDSMSLWIECQGQN